MCGIIGYVGEQQLVPVIIEGLRRLEYRGYDSAGIAVVDRRGRLELRRAAGKLKNLEDVISSHPLEGVYGLGHTRWATHGRPTEENAHPHRDCSGRVVVVHNGIIENYVALKRRLQSEGHRFVTETDTEVVAHLVESYLDKDKSLEEAVRLAVNEFEGIFAIAVLSASVPETIVAARLGPPIVLGFGEHEFFVASDIPAILQHTRDVSFLGDGQLAVIRRSGIEVLDFEGNRIQPSVQRINWDPIMAEKGGYSHFMLKEIFEQPRAVRDTTKERVSLESGKVFLDQLDLSEEELRGMRELKLVACGTSYHAALAGKYMIEELARIPVEVDYASEFRYRDPIIDAKSLILAISQSGETADVLAAMRAAREKKAHVLAICNVLGSTVTREAEGTVYTHAGPEIGVASTKTFVTQLAALYLIALYLGELRGMLSRERVAALIQQLNEMPVKMEKALNCADAVKEISKKLSRSRDFLYLGRGIQFPIALEGALKLKEVSYIHAEGYPAGEMKHGPNALIDERLPVVVVNTLDRSSAASRLRYEKTLSNIVEVKAREGMVFAVVTEGDTETAEVARQVIAVPECSELLAPLLSILPLQLLAYHIAVRRGCDVDQPRNLAKSVTVE